MRGYLDQVRPGNGVSTALSPPGTHSKKYHSQPELPYIYMYPHFPRLVVNTSLGNYRGNTVVPGLMQDYPHGYYYVWVRGLGMSEAPASTGMGPDEPVGSSRSNHRNRNMFILGGLALVLVAGVILAGVIPTGDRAGTTATDPSASATPSATATATATDDPTEEPVAVTTCAEGGACVVGDIGPGGGLVFYDAGSAQDWGQYLEMAPKTWGDNETTGTQWCSDGSTSIAGAVGTAVGTGSANTTAMLALPCTSGAAFSADAYDGGGFTDWFLPSKDELNAMCNYSNYPTTPPTWACTGSQDGTFSTGTYGFDSVVYWSSSQNYAYTAWFQLLGVGSQKYVGFKTNALRVRPVRAF